MHHNITARLVELRQTRDGMTMQLQKLNRDAKSIEARASAAGRDMSASELASVERITSQFDAIELELKNVDRDIRAAEHDLELDGGPPLPSRGRQAPPNALAGNVPGARAAATPPPIGVAAPRTFAAVFAKHRPDPVPYANQFESLAEFAAAVASDAQDSRLVRNATMTTPVGPDGGFAVPTEFLGPILDAALEREVIRPGATIVPMASKSATAGVFDYADGTSSKRAGLQLTWGAEATALTEQKGKLRELNLSAHKGSIFVRVSSELLNDAPNFDRQLNDAMVNAVAAGLDLAFISGTGAGQPLGILNSPALITVAKIGSQAANTVLLGNLADMAGRLAPASFGNAVWLVHPTVVTKLYGLSYTVQNLGGSENVGGAAVQAVTQDANGQLRIYGRPCLVTDACSALSSAGDIILADRSRYCVGMRAGATLQRDTSRYFDSDEIAFRLILRVDGQPFDREATKLRDGSNTVSPFVALGAR